jgi:mannose-6-phosphate isomerase-like protein (cupin superfamily)
MTSRGADAYTVAGREDAIDFMADYPEYGEQRWYTSAIAADQVSFSWRRMRPRTGGRGSYGHRHPGQDEVYFVISGIVTFKIDGDVFEATPQTAVRVARRRVPLGPQRHRRRGRVADLLAPPRRAPDREAG